MMAITTRSSMSVNAERRWERGTGILLGRGDRLRWPEKAPPRPATGETVAGHGTARTGADGPVAHGGGGRRRPPASEFCPLLIVLAGACTADDRPESGFAELLQPARAAAARAATSQRVACVMTASVRSPRVVAQPVISVGSKVRPSR